MTPGFVVDLPTLGAVTGFVTVTGGFLLLFSWFQNRSVTGLALWGAGYLMGSAGAALVGLRGFAPSMASVCASGALLCAAYGLIWAGSRSFESRRIGWHWVLAGPAVWLAACQLYPFHDIAEARIALVSTIMAIYTLLNAAEIWHARERDLISRWPMLALLLVHSGFLLARIPLAPGLTPEAMDAGPTGAVIIAAFEGLFTVLCLAFLRVGMAKERAELEQRRAALTDALTGIANRRAFFDRGAPLLEAALAERRPAALLLFDLDRFKTINDTAGHQAGDGVLKSFAGLVGSALRPDDLFGRIGGEEFACLMVDATMTSALQTAEQMRSAFAAMRFPGLDMQVTVSGGIAIAGEAARTMEALLARADRALYRAKADGRNRVALASPTLVDAGDTWHEEDASHPPAGAARRSHRAAQDIRPREPVLASPA